MRKLRLKKIDLSKFKLKLPKLKKKTQDDLGLKKYKLNKEKVKKRLPLAIGIILIIIALAVFPNTLSRYASSGVSGTNINVAYSLLDVVQTENGEIVESFKLPEVNPDSKFNSYVIQVRNYKEDPENASNSKRINVKMRYYMEVIVTTNLPMTYKMTVRADNGTNYPYGTNIKPYESHVSEPCSDEAGDHITRSGLYCDAHGTYYYKFVFPTKSELGDQEYSTMDYNKNMKDTVTLQYSLPDNRNTSSYQDIIEMVSIKIHAEQYVKNK